MKEFKWLAPMLGAKIRELLAKHGGNVTRAAKDWNGPGGVECPRRTFYRACERLGIDPGEYRGKEEGDE